MEKVLRFISNERNTNKKLIIIIMAENESLKVLWDFLVQIDHEINAQKPNFIVIDNESSKCSIRYKNGL